MKQKIAELINVVFGFRKFLILLVLYAIAIIFRIKGLINGAEMVQLIEPTTIAFIGANGVEHVVSAVKDHYAAKRADETPYEDIVEVPTPDQEAADLAEEAKKE
jgi:hypothetical protein